MEIKEIIVGLVAADFLQQPVDLECLVRAFSLLGVGEAEVNFSVSGLVENGDFVYTEDFAGLLAREKIGQTEAQNLILCRFSSELYKAIDAMRAGVGINRAMIKNME